MLPDALTVQVQQALDMAPCGLLRMDSAGVVRRANAAACRWLGYERRELLGRRLPDLLTIGGRIFHQTHLAPLLQIQHSVSEVKLDFLRRDGTTIPVVLNAQRHETPQGTFTEVALFVAHDRDKYERELVASRQRLEQSVADARALQADAKDRALFAEQMMGIVSHDLRNPLATIQMGTGLLTRTETRTQQLNVLGRIARATERANRLIADLLDFTQARLGKGLTAERRAVDLHATVAEVVEELSQAHPNRRLVHEAEGDGECIGDSDRIAQLVGNLAANALAYGSTDHPVTVRSVVRPWQFAVSVHNHGAPIPLEAHSRLFEPLARGTAQGSSVRSVGLGLYIVSEIAKAHGGQVAVSSSEAEGTTFTATFPRGVDATSPRA